MNHNEKSLVYNHNAPRQLSLPFKLLISVDKNFLGCEKFVESRRVAEIHDPVVGVAFALGQTP